ncbi:hypothetical protein EV363DRAFT_1400662 [Boletus edulis]|nr:hypothetical protein EV363DRAFT_1400662 [Boletus edulis]
MWILAPFLPLLGFGPLGPIKGSIAAWCQSYFWGAAVPAGSWFSWLQAAGMTMPLKWAWFIGKIPLLILGGFAWLFRVVRG